MSDTDDLKEDIRARFRAARPDDPTQPCPTAADIVVVEIQEVVRRGSQAKFIAPRARVQYVNLDVADDPRLEHPEYGRALTFRARVQSKPGKRGSLVGKTVYWFSRDRPENRQNLVGNVRSGFGKRGPSALRAATRVGADGWTEEVVFFLSRYGGDIFEVVATESPLCLKGFVAGPYTVWRRIYFDVSEMLREDGGKFALSSPAIERAKECLADSFVDFDDLGARNSPPFQRNFTTAEELFEWADDYATNLKSPQKVHVCMINRMDLKGTSTVEHAEDVATSVVFTSTATIDADTDNGAWLIVATYRRPGGSERFVIPDDTHAVTLVGHQDGPRRFKIDFSGTSIVPSSENPVDVSVLYHRRSHAIGRANTNRVHLFVALGTIERNHSSATSVVVGETIAHEFGHQLALVQHLPWTSPTDKAHCKYPSCVMWWKASTEERSKALGSTKPLPFHHEDISDPGCRTYVRQKDLTKSGLNSVLRFPR